MLRRDLKKLLYPKSIAVIGASRSRQKVGFIIIKNIAESGFKGSIYPVNPQAEAIHDLKCFPDYQSLPEVPDLAIISIPANFVLQSLKEIAQKGTKNVIILSSGFKELGEEGQKLEGELKEVAEEHEINLLGPNCLGFVNNLYDLNATFSHAEKQIGNLRFISQSGAIASSIFDWSESIGLGFSEFITLGNKAVLSENDILSFWLNNQDEAEPAKEYFLQDKRLSRVRPIGMYLESIDYGEEFLNIVSQVTLKDPVFVLKPGQSKEARKAMQSHTGSIAGEDNVLEAALIQAGAVRCEGIEDLFDCAKAFSWENAPEGPNVAIISNAGGPAVISTDFVEKYGLKLANISEETKKKLAEYLPRESSFINPVDVLGDAVASRYAKAIDIVLGQSGVDALVVILTPQMMTEIHLTAEFIGRLSDVHKKPIFCAFIGGNHVEAGSKVLNMHKIPSFQYPERAIRVLGMMWKWRERALERALDIQKLTHVVTTTEINTADQVKIDEILRLAREQGTEALNSFEANEVVKSWNINVPKTTLIRNFDDALEFTQASGWPVVIKLSSSHALHKTELGGVIVNVNNRAKLQRAFETMMRRIEKLDINVKNTASIQIQKQITGGIEVIIGVKRDKNFGHVLMFGAGGTLTEVFNDRNLHMLPINRFEAEKLVMKSKIAKVLKGYRGEKEYCVTKLYYMIEKVSELVSTFPEIEEFEINPVIVTKEDVWAIDPKVLINN